MFEFGILFNAGSGTDSLLLDALAKRTGCTFEKVTMPRARIWLELKAGAIDMATAAVATPERRAFGYMVPYLISRNVVLLRKSAKALPSSMAALESSDLRLGVVRSFKHEPAYDAMFERLAAQGRVKEAVDVAELLLFLERGVVDAVVSQPIVYRRYLSSTYLDEEIIFRDWAPKDQFSVGNFIFSRKSFTPEQARNWDRLIESMTQDGAIYKIFREFLPPAQARELVYTGPRDPG